MDKFNKIDKNINNKLTSKIENLTGTTSELNSKDEMDIDIIEEIKNEIKEIKNEIEEIKKMVISHENELKERKKITNNYTDAVLSKIEILKNMIKKNIGDTEQFISPHLLEVENIEEQIKQTGKISDKQFKTLNEIYLKQKRL